jgi:chemotaxis protein CheD
VIAAARCSAPAGSAPDRRFLHLGQIIADAGGCRLSTIVGSCVAVCMWDSVRRVGGMNHFLLPDAPHVAAPVTRPWSYGELAMPALVAQLVALGASPRGLTAKLFGGAALTRSADPAAPGARNGAFARGWLAERGIPVAAEDVGGSRGRKVLFDTGSGDVTVLTL